MMSDDATRPEMLDLSALLAPVSEVTPAGADVRHDPQASALYYALKDARKEARDKEQGRDALDGDGGAAESAIPDARAEWRAVAEQATTILCEHGKDLEVAAWLVEAAVRLHGFAGLRDGLRLLRGLVASFWDTCFPAIDEDGAEYRVAPLAGLNGLDRDGTLIVPILNVPIVAGSSDEHYGTWRYQQAVAIAQTADPGARQKRIDDGGLTLEDMDRESNETADTFFIETSQALSECIEEYAALTRELDERCGEQSPPSSNIRNALQACDVALRYVGKRALAAAAPAPGDAATDADTAAPGGTSGPAPMSRDEALRQLLALAEFFRRTEPHSPLSYAIEQVVRWGRMPLPELLQELVDEDAARSQIFRLAGIRAPGQAE